jgi:TonB family protein
MSVAMANGQTATATPHSDWVFAPHPEVPTAPDIKGRRLHGHGLYVIHFDAKTGQAVSVEVKKSTGSNILDRAMVKAFIRWRCRPGAYTKIQVPVSYNERN